MLSAKVRCCLPKSDSNNYSDSQRSDAQVPRPVITPICDFILAVSKNCFHSRLTSLPHLVIYDAFFPSLHTEQGRIPIPRCPRQFWGAGPPFPSHPPYPPPTTSFTFLSLAYLISRPFDLPFCLDFSK